MPQPFIREIKRKNGKISKIWYIRYFVNGKDTWESIGKVGVVTKSYAQNILNERLRQIRLGQEDQIIAVIPTLNEYKEEYIVYKRDVKKNRSWKRDVLSLKNLSKILGNLFLSKITSKHIKDYQSIRLNEKVSNATINRELSCLKNLFNEAKKDRKFFGDNPVSLVRFLDENNEKDRILTFEEEKALLNNCSDYLKPIIITALNTGMRKMEILSLKWENVDLKNRVITILATNSKSKRIKYIPINSYLKNELNRQKLKTGYQEFVFLNSLGKNYKRKDSLNSFKRVCKKTGINGVTFHTLRHTFGTRALEASGNIVTVNKILGHRSLQTTMRYVHIDKALYETVEKINKAK